MSLPRYDRYGASGIPQLGDIPSHWRAAPLKAVASHNDEVLEEDTPDDWQLLYVDISSVGASQGITAKAPMMFSEAPSRARRRVRDGDVIISTVRTYLRAIAMVTDPEENVIVSTGFAVVRPRHGLHPRFLGFLVSSSYFVDEVIARSTGVSYPAINANELMRIAVPIPPLKEQLLIATFLEREIVRIHVLVQEQQSLIDLLSEKRQALISHAVTKGLNPDAPMKPSGVAWLGDVPAHWDVPRIAELFREVSETGSGELPILSVSIHHGVSDEELAEEALDRKVTRSEDRTKYKRVAPNDLVYNMMRAWQGGFGTVRVEGMVSPAYVVARPLRALDTQYVEYLLRSPQAVEEMRRHSRGITDFRLRLYWDEFKNMRIPLPPPQEVSAICAHISETTERFDGLTATCERSVRLLEERRTALISAAVTGQIDVRGLVAAAAADLRVGPTGHPAAARTTTRGRSAAEVA